MTTPQAKRAKPDDDVERKVNDVFTESFFEASKICIP